MHNGEMYVHSYVSPPKLLDIGVKTKSCRANLILGHTRQLIPVLFMKPKLNSIKFLKNGSSFKKLIHDGKYTSH
jgi:hypothetical protein